MHIQTLINKLNFMLKNNFEESVFMQLIKSLKDDFSLDIKILDFTIDAEKQANELQKKKLHCIQNGHYEMAARLRDEERDVLTRIELMSAIDVKESVFLLKPDGVYYCYVGNMKNDELIYKIIIL